MHMINQ